MDTPSQSATRTPSSRPGSSRSSVSQHASSRTLVGESTPLLINQNQPDQLGDGEAQHEQSTDLGAFFRRFRPTSSSNTDGKPRRRWPSAIALLLLCLLTLAIMLLGFLMPQTMKEYALQAKEIEITSISLPEFTATGAKARVQGTFWMNADKVEKKSVRDLGRFGTWVARKVQTGESEVAVTLPDYDCLLLGTAMLPSIVADIRNGHKNALDILADVKPGDTEAVRRLANDFMDGKLESLNVLAVADVKIRSGLISLPAQNIEQVLSFSGVQIPTVPSFNISRLNIHELPDGSQGLGADAEISVHNDYPVDLAAPPLRFTIKVDNCRPSQPQLAVADATLQNVHVQPKQDLDVNVTAIIRQFASNLTTACPGTGESPLDSLLGSYMRGGDTTLYVTGAKSPDAGTPDWISDLTSSITVPVPFPGKSFGSLIRNFSLADVHFSLPSPLADPGSPESKPRISAGINVLVALPQEMNLDLNVSQVRANADVFYKKKKMGQLDLRQWQNANSSRVKPSKDDKQPLLKVVSAIKNAPLDITDDDVFSDVIQAMLFGDKAVMLNIKADVDVKVHTALGEVTVQKVPAEGIVPVNPIGVDKGFKSFSPKIGNLEIVHTTEDSMTIQAEVNFTNPTPYSATVPFVDILISTNGSMLGHAVARNITVGPGVNKNLVAQAIWSPKLMGGEKSRIVGRDLLSQYVSGFNTTLTLHTHNGSFPSQPALGRALQFLNITIPTPRLGNSGEDGDGDGDGDDGEEHGPHFIRDATMHLFSSSATFTLLSPLSHTSLFINHINASATYKDNKVGNIFYGEDFDNMPEEFEVSPGESTSPRLFVDWNLGSVGYDAIRRALGGTLKLSASATVGIRIGQWQERIWYLGNGIGAHVKP